jgi:tripartite-type tricarboxylate transporter receptor subunit TctC
MKLLNAAVATLAVSLCAAPSFAADDSYPEKDINLIVGFAAGGGTDTLARLIAPHVEKNLKGAKIIVKNVPGAGGQIGITQVAKAKPDGYTIGLLTLPGTVARTYDRKTDYGVSSFTYLANIVNDPSVIVVNKASNVNSLADLVKLGKQGDKGVTVAVSTMGGDDQFVMMALGEQGGIRVDYVPFKGTAPARSALMGGHVDSSSMNLSEVIGFEDELKALCVAQKERSPLAPNIPTAKEQGFNIEMGTTRGFVAPANLPAPVREKLLAAFKAAYDDPEFQKSMKATGAQLEYVGGKDYEELTKQQDAIARKVWQTTPWTEAK